MEQVLRRLAFPQQYVGHLFSLYRNWITVSIGYYSIVLAGVSTGPVNIRSEMTAGARWESIGVYGAGMAVIGAP